MASIAHVTVGMAAGRLFARDSARPWAWIALLAGLSLMPDLDFPLMRIVGSVPETSPLVDFYHRGATHSLAFAVAAGALTAGIARVLGVRGLRLFVFATLVVASHGALDAFTDGGAGIEFLWPLSSGRWHAPWTPIPVAPLGLVRFFTSERGRHCALVETVGTLPLIVYALWPRRARRGVAEREIVVE